MSKKQLSAINDVVKRPHIGEVDWTEEQLLELMECVEDPLYFMSNFMKVQHPTKGALPFHPYPFQNKIIQAFHQHRFNCLMAARQVGKCSTSETTILIDGKQDEIGSLIAVSFRDKIINWFERKMIELKRKRCNVERFPI